MHLIQAPVAVWISMGQIPRRLRREERFLSDWYPAPRRVSQKAPDGVLCSPHPKPPGSAGILPASAGTG